MGIFGSRKKVYVESMTMPLVEDTPNIVKQSLLTSIVHERPIAEDLNANLMNGLGSSLSLYYKYGKSKYYYGLPSGSVIAKYAYAETVELVIAAEIKSKISIDFSIFSSPSAELFATDYLIKVRGWVQNTGEISKPLNEGATTYGGSQFINDKTIRINYLANANYSEDITIEPIDLDSQYYHAGYYLVDSNGVVGSDLHWWFYPEASKKYDILTADYLQDSPYYPVVPLRYDNTDFTIDDDSERYKTSRKLLKKLKLDITELGLGVNGSPDIDQVDHAYIIMGISPDTKSKSGMKYLFEYFKHLEVNSAFSKVDYFNWLSFDIVQRGRQTPPMNVVTVKEEGLQYHIDMGYVYIDSKIVTGSIGKVKSVTTEIQLTPDEQYAEYSYNTSVFILRKQLNKTQYEEVIVFGLKHVDYIYKSHTIDTSLSDVMDKENEKNNFIIPLHSGVIDSMSFVYKTELAYEAIRIGFHSVEIKKLKWYQTGFFKIVAVIVSIAVTIYSLGTMSASLGAALGFAGSSAIIAGAVVYGVISIGVQYGFTLLVDILGIELAALLAIASAFLGYYKSGFIPTEALSAFQSGINAGLKQGIQNQFIDLQLEMDALELEMQVGQAELDKLAEEYNTERMVDPLRQYDSSTGLALPWETPEMYYNTRIHIGNMAAFSLMSVDSYVDGQLQLEGVTAHGGI